MWWYNASKLHVRPSSYSSAVFFTNTLEINIIKFHCVGDGGIEIVFGSVSKKWQPDRYILTDEPHWWKHSCSSQQSRWRESLAVHESKWRYSNALQKIQNILFFLLSDRENFRLAWWRFALRLQPLTWYNKLSGGNSVPLKRCSCLTGILSPTEKCTLKGDI